MISATESWRMALANGNTDEEDKTLVLFVFCFHNFSCWYPYYGFRMDKPCYSAHHYEKEVVLMDGISFIVLKIEDVKIKIDMNDSLRDNDAEDDINRFWGEYNGRAIKVIYLFNA